MGQTWETWEAAGQKEFERMLCLGSIWLPRFGEAGWLRGGRGCRQLKPSKTESYCFCMVVLFFVAQAPSPCWDPVLWKVSRLTHALCDSGLTGYPSFPPSFLAGEILTISAQMKKR